MKNLFICFLLLMVFTLLSFTGNTQPIGYYNGTEGKKGDELKSALHQIISNHVDFSYYFAKNIINYSDADPNNENNVILFYLQVSRSASLYGTGGDYINREHVWAKSHGNFADVRPMDGDAYNLHPSDASVNETRSNKDFDNVQPGGIQHPEATSCWYTDSTWEPGPLTKGQVARILFYMSTRYDGTNGEMNLKLVRHNNNYPNPEFGNLTTLLEWNNQYPPSDFERRRNERVYQIQQNRNPFVDFPEFANYIWNNQSPSGAVLEEFKMTPEFPAPEQEINLSIKLATGSATPETVKLYWGNFYDSEDNQSTMSANQSVYKANINLSDYQPGETVYFKVEATENQIKKYIRATYLLPKPKEVLTISTIKQVQGNGDQTPFKDQTVTIAGRVSSNFDGSFYIQNENSPRNGICIYGSLQTGRVGDSLVVTGTATEYSNLTELTGISYLYNFQDNKEIVPLEIPITSINENYEGMLVEIKGVEFEKQGTAIPNGNYSYTFSNPNGSSVIFSKNDSRLVGKKIPSGKINLVGVIGQYQSVYQILPRDMNDLKLATGNGINLSIPNTVNVYPNPASSVLKIKTSAFIDNIKVYDLAGRLIIDENGDKREISVKKLLPGIYLINISLSGKEVIHTKFTISK